MAEKEMNILDLVVETHIGLERQGPGSREITIKALSFLDGLNENSLMADIACGCGGQTIVLAQNMPGHIIGVDICPDFIDVLNDSVERSGLGGRVKGIVGNMEDLPFQKEELDVIWSEGAIDRIGFERGLTEWNGFLKKNGHIAVTCPSWLTDERPAAVERFWTDAGSVLDTVEHNISIMRKTGYRFIAAFTLPEKCWTDDYFVPREAAEKRLLEKYAGNEIAENYIESGKYEAELYSKYGQYYGYVFYIGKKM